MFWDLLLKVMCNHNFNIFLNQDSNIYSEKKIRQGLRTRKHFNHLKVMWNTDVIFKQV